MSKTPCTCGLFQEDHLAKPGCAWAGGPIITLELTPAEFDVIKDALDRFEECYDRSEWKEMHELREDYDSTCRVVENAAREFEGE